MPPIQAQDYQSDHAVLPSLLQMDSSIWQRLMEAGEIGCGQRASER